MKACPGSNPGYPTKKGKAVEIRWTTEEPDRPQSTTAGVSPMTAPSESVFQMRKALTNGPVFPVFTEVAKMSEASDVTGITGEDTVHSALKKLANDVVKGRIVPIPFNYRYSQEIRQGVKHFVKQDVPGTEDVQFDEMETSNGRVMNVIVSPGNREYVPVRMRRDDKDRWHRYLISRKLYDRIMQVVHNSEYGTAAEGQVGQAD